MSRPSFNQFGSLYHYLLVVNPDNYVGSRIRKIKEYFGSIYGCRSAPHQKPHITLFNFIQHEGLQKPIVDRLSKVAKSIKPFQVELDGYNQFPSNHTIYIDVTAPAPLVYLNTRLKRNLNALFKGLIMPVRYTSKYHLTISRGMPAEQHEKAWEEWRVKDFKQSFIATDMKLLKRPLKEPFRKYQDLSFSFTGTSNPDLGVQTSLFTD